MGGAAAADASSVLIMSSNRSGRGGSGGGSGGCREPGWEQTSAEASTAVADGWLVSDPPRTDVGAWSALSPTQRPRVSAAFDPRACGGTTATPPRPPQRGGAARAHGASDRRREGAVTHGAEAGVHRGEQLRGGRLQFRMVRAPRGAFRTPRCGEASAGAWDAGVGHLRRRESRWEGPTSTRPRARGARGDRPTAREPRPRASALTRAASAPLGRCRSLASSWSRLTA